MGSNCLVSEFLWFPPPYHREVVVGAYGLRRFLGAGKITERAGLQGPEAAESDQVPDAGHADAGCGTTRSLSLARKPKFMGEGLRVGREIRFFHGALTTGEKK